MYSHSKKKLQFAGRIAALAERRLSQRVLAWQPVGVRHVGGQFRGWSDCIEKLIGADWMASAMDTDLWLLAEHRYVHRDDTDELFGKRRRGVAIF